MKWKSYKRNLTGTTKTFLVLPLVDDNSDCEMNKNSSLRLFTKTWTRNQKNEKDENARPLTATLERPQILDIRLMGKIDMSLMTKDFLSLSNVCRVPLTTINRTKPRRKTAILERRRPLSNLPLAITPADKLKLQKKIDTTSEDSWEDESIHSSRESSHKLKLKTKIRPPAIITTKKLEVPKPEEINNNNFKLARKRNLNSRKIETLQSTKLLPEPCTTCGRPDLPERFHSHPTTPMKPTKKIEVKIPVKNSVQKPMAMKYKSKLENKQEDRRDSLPAQKLVHTPPIVNGEVKMRGPRTLTCYICGREFGTASLPLHEPKCLQKWERENANQPTHLRRKAPVKPDASMTKEDWNKFAWEASQSILTPCQNCGRTFYPDRLVVHQRSCKGVPRLGKPLNSSDKNQSVQSLSSLLPSSVPCCVCGKLFGTKSIKIHEPQCLKKWHVRNDHLPAEEREPIANHKVLENARSNTSVSSEKSEDRPQSRRPPMFPCYLCGRLFGVSSIYIHEPQCLKKWKAENDKLPLEKRRKIPQKPDVKFTKDGTVDYQAMEEANWQSHLSQLVPCRHCKRTFNPDRVDIHERNCKGPT